MQSVLLHWLSQGRNITGQQTLKLGSPVSQETTSCPKSAAENGQVLFAPAAVDNHNDSSSSDSEDPVSRGARRYVELLTAQRNRDSAVVDTCSADAAENVHVDEVADIGQPATQTGTVSDSSADSDVQAICYCPPPGNILAQTHRHACNRNW